MALKWMATTDYNTDNGGTEISNARLVHFMRMYSGTAGKRPRVQSEDVLRIPATGGLNYSFARTNRSLPDTYDFRYQVTQRGTGGSLDACYNSAITSGQTAATGRKWGISWSNGIFLYHYTPSGDYYCWDGSAWQLNTWISTGITWVQDTNYYVSIEKTATDYVFLISTNADLSSPTVLATAARSDVRDGAGSTDYLTLGNDYTETPSAIVDYTDIYANYRNFSIAAGQNTILQSGIDAPLLVAVGAPTAVSYTH